MNNTRTFHEIILTFVFLKHSPLNIDQVKLLYQPLSSTTFTALAEVQQTSVSAFTSAEVFT